MEKQTIEDLENSINEMKLILKRKLFKNVVHKTKKKFFSAVNKIIELSKKIECKNAKGVFKMSESKLTELKEQLEEMLINNIDSLPSDFNKERFAINALEAVKKIKDVHKHNLNELRYELIKGAYLGLDFLNEECAIVPRKGTLCFDTQYQGEMKLIRKYSVNTVKNIHADIVKEGDFFEYGVDHGIPFLNHRPAPFNKGVMLGVFCLIEFMNGSIQYEVMDKSEVDKIRDMAATHSPAWINFYHQQAKKVAIKRCSKKVSKDFPNTQAAVAYSDSQEIDFKNTQKLNTVNSKPRFLKQENNVTKIEYENVEIITEEQYNTLRDTYKELQNKNLINTKKFEQKMEMFGIDDVKQLPISAYEDFLAEMQR